MLAVRKIIHPGSAREGSAREGSARERGLCFYCLRRLNARVRCLDHVVPRVQWGSDSHLNLVSCCLECNSEKGEKAAGDFLRRLYRERRLTAVELSGRLRALDDLASGKLRPLLPAPAKGSGQLENGN